MNYLLLSVGRRVELLKCFKKTIGVNSTLVATDMSPYAPALYVADKQHIVSNIYNCNYIDMLIGICRSEHINVVTTCIDPEIEILAKHRIKFEELGIIVLTPERKTAEICFDKYMMFKYLQRYTIPTIMTWNSIDEFDEIFQKGDVIFPVFVKPKCGSGSVGAKKIYNYNSLCHAVKENHELIIQEYMDGIDLDVDVYVDIISHEPVSIFAKKKLETRIGGACKAISFKDIRLCELIQRICKIFKFYGPINMDFFYCQGKYYLSEINPRFGGAYIHAYASGVNFIELIENNLHHKINIPCFEQYSEDIIMMMYDSIIIKNKDELIYQ